MKPLRLRAGATLVLAAFQGGAYAADEVNPTAVLEAPTVEVVGTTPLPGIGTPVNEVPANVTTISNRQIEQQQSVSVPDFLNNNLGSVSVSEPGGNPFQPTVNFRGFQSSPLLGQPQGLSVFQGGVRINEAVGDVVNWDLIPLGAIANMAMIPGSNPVFGLNTLGGALSMNTKSGREFPGGQVTLYGGSFGTFNGNFEYGGKKDNFDYYIYGNYFDSDGWRDYSSSLVRQAFGKVGYQTSDLDVDLSYAFADNNLSGTQALPIPMLNSDPKLAYTWPDTTNNKVNFVNLRLSKVLDNDKILGGNVYWRQFRTSSVGSNVNDSFGGPNNGAACDFTLPVGQQCPGTNDASDISTNGWGAALQFTLLKSLGKLENRLIMGASYDAGNTTFTQSSQDAIFNASREAVGVTPFAVDTIVGSTNAYTGIYFTDTLSLTKQLLLTLAGRYNNAQIDINDELGNKPAVNGNNTFSRFNPAIGLNFNPSTAVNTYATYNEGMRAPTAVELTCADPNAPCPLPNAFLSDPPLQPVVAKTFEIGGRGTLTTGTSWTAAIYRTNLTNDIQFVSSGGGGNVGYFTNIPESRRQGIELGVQQRWGPVTLEAQYGYIDATYQSSFAISSPNNSTANGNGDIQVQPGNHIPGISPNNFKFRAAWQANPKLFLGATLAFFTSQYAQGDENNQDVNGKVPGYTVVNLDGSYNLTDRWQVFGRINNLFNTKYQTAGVLGQNFFQGANFTYDQAAASAQQFRTPGAPFGIFVGVTYSFGRAPAQGPRDD